MQASKVTWCLRGTCSFHLVAPLSHGGLTALCIQLAKGKRDDGKRHLCLLRSLSSEATPVLTPHWLEPDARGAGICSPVVSHMRGWLWLAHHWLPSPSFSRQSTVAEQRLCWGRDLMGRGLMRPWGPILFYWKLEWLGRGCIHYKPASLAVSGMSMLNGFQPATFRPHLQVILIFV